VASRADRNRLTSHSFRIGPDYKRSRIIEQKLQNGMPMQADANSAYVRQPTQQKAPRNRYATLNAA
jgi:hypothetical protein